MEGHIWSNLENNKTWKQKFGRNFVKGGVLILSPWYKLNLVVGTPPEMLPDHKTPRK